MYLEQIREIVAEHGRLLVDPRTLEADSDLYQAGLTSLSTVNLMLALEERFDVEFKDSMLGRKTFGSLRALQGAIAELKGTDAAQMALPREHAMNPGIPPASALGGAA